VPGWSAGPTVIQPIPPYPTSFADLEAEGVGLVTCFAAHDGILAVARAAWRR
jgi:hypothetical protein